MTLHAQKWLAKALTTIKQKTHNSQRLENSARGLAHILVKTAAEMKLATIWDGTAKQNAKDQTKSRKFELFTVYYGH